ncbi:Transposase (pseudogene), family 8 [Zobellia galactanivorans]|nr:Transposase (pseudogene), family 8 [Zobellia galactanivorans]
MIIKFTEYDTKKIHIKIKDQGSIGSLERAAQPCRTGPEIPNTSDTDQWLEAGFPVGSETVFEKGKTDKRSEAEKKNDQLLKTIGELKVENDFLKDALR